MQNKVSIVIPTYNGERFVSETINSCLQQTYDNIEIIVIDDASNDSTLDILSGYREKINLKKNKNNLGIVKTVNKALLSVESEFFILLGQDDLLPERHIELLISEFTSSEIIAVYCNSYLIDESGKTIKLARNDNIQDLKTNNSMYFLSIDNFINSCGMLHRTKVFKSIGGWDAKYKNYGEWLFYIKALSYGEIKYTKKSRSFYRRHKTNITNSFAQKNVRLGLEAYYQECRRLAHESNRNTTNQILKYYINLIKLKLRSFKK